MGAKQSCGKDDAADVTIESVENNFEARDEILPSTLQPCKGIHDDLNSEGTFNVDDMSDVCDLEAASPAGGYSSAGTTLELPSPRNGCTLTTLMSVSTSESRRERMSHLEVEQEMIRGISLAATLANRGALWRTSPADLPQEKRAELWNKTKRVGHYDIFFSHTWRTKGSEKILALLFQFGWHIALLLWILVAGITFALVATGVLVSPFKVEISLLSFSDEIAYFPWIAIATAGSFIVSYMILPYVLLFSRPTTCFLDVVCIHQTDEINMEKGVYGLGGFLRLSEELHVLWSPPYFSRLWCVFELAAFRKANPSKRIVINPLFAAKQTAVLIFGCYVASLIYNVLSMLHLGRTRSYIGMFMATLPAWRCFHSIRASMQEKHALISQLEEFDVGKAECRMQEDKELILAAINAWYGSEQRFTEYVRGPLREELLKSASSAHLPLSYAVLMCTGAWSSSLDSRAAVIQAGGPVHALLSTSLIWLVVTFKVAWYLCDILAAPGSTRLENWVRTTLVYLGTLAFFFAGFMLFMEIDKMGIVGTICNAICQVALVLLVYGRYNTLRCWMKEWLVKHCRV